MKTKPFFKIHGISLLLLGICLMYFIFIKQCNNDPVIADHTDRDLAILELRGDSIIKCIQLDRIKDSLFQLSIEKAQSDLKVNSLETKLEKSVSYSRYIAQQLKDAKELIEDTGMIAVSPNYVDWCDTCAAELVKQAELAYQYKIEVHNREKLHKKEISLKDSTISIEKRSNIMERHAFELMKRGYNKMAQQTEPRNKVYAGIVTQGSQSTFFRAFGLGGTLVTKRQRLWGIDALMDNSGELVFQGRTQFLISFRHKK